MTERNIEGLLRHSREQKEIVIDSIEEAMIRLCKTKDYKKITISELCKKAGVSRVAFYNNFETKEQVITTIIDDFNNKAIEHLGSPFRATTSKDWYIGLFGVMVEYESMVRVLISAEFQQRYMTLLNQMVLHDETIPACQKYKRIIWVGGVINVLIYWLSNGKKESVDEIAEYCATNLNPHDLSD